MNPPPRLRDAAEVQRAHDALQVILAAPEPTLHNEEQRFELMCFQHTLCWVLGHGGGGALFDTRVAAVYHALEDAGYVRVEVKH